jgi:bifunctional NMN adenylyltransferase/nudix hydrolase
MDKVSLDFVVYILRGQPFTIAHFKTISHALELSKKVIVVIGSYRSPRTIKNPWNFEEREKMVKSCFKNEIDRLIFVKLRDFTYDDNTWFTALQKNITEISEITKDSKIKLIGCFKDESSYYIKYFPQWGTPIIQQLLHVNNKIINATDVRELLFETEINWKKIQSLCPTQVLPFLLEFTKTEIYSKLKNEFEFIKKYQKSWENSPYPPMFVTTDAVVVKSCHVLVIKRKINPGKGCYALPGGFLHVNQNIEDSMLRELKEETKIDIDKIVLQRCIKKSHVFDHPKRSLRGRTITHAFLVVLNSDGILPKVKGDDDALEAKWLSFNDVVLEEENFFEDHFHIIQYFINQKF